MLRFFFSHAHLLVLVWGVLSASAVSADEKADSQQLLKEKGYKLVGMVVAASDSRSSGRTVNSVLPLTRKMSLTFMGCLLIDVMDRP